MYILNVNTNTLHIKGGCYHTKGNNPDWKFFETEDEVVSKEKRYIKNCKLCYKGR